MTTRALLIRATSCAMLTVMPCIANAHALIGAGLIDGFVHPVGGFDHLLAMVAIGLVSARIGGVSLYALPAVFVISMASGFLVATNLPELGQMAELGILVSVLSLGLFLLMPELLLKRAAWLASALFGLSHGYAHGVELPLAASPWMFSAGFLSVSAGLHVLGVLIGKVFLLQQRPTLGFSVAGVAVGMSGLALIALR